METARAINNTAQKYTYADYLTWDDGQRWELINGEAYLLQGPVGLAPAPNRFHQELSGALFYQFFAAVSG